MYSRRINPFIIQKAREMRHNPTEAEAQMWEILKSQVMPKFPKHRFYSQSGQDVYILDFYCPTLRLGIEVDGGIHDDTQEYDKQRDIRLAWHLIEVHRFRNEDVLNNPQIVAEQLCQIIQNRERFFNSARQQVYMRTAGKYPPESWREDQSLHSKTNKVTCTRSLRNS